MKAPPIWPDLSLISNWIAEDISRFFKITLSYSDALRIKMIYHMPLSFQAIAFHNWGCTQPKGSKRQGTTKCRFPRERRVLLYFKLYVSNLSTILINISMVSSLSSYNSISKSRKNGLFFKKCFLFNLSALFNRWKNIV